MGCLPPYALLRWLQAHQLVPDRLLRVADRHPATGCLICHPPCHYLPAVLPTAAPPIFVPLIFVHRVTVCRNSAGCLESLWQRILNCAGTGHPAGHRRIRHHPAPFRRFAAPHRPAAAWYPERLGWIWTATPVFRCSDPIYSGLPLRPDFRNLLPRHRTNHWPRPQPCRTFRASTSARLAIVLRISVRRICCRQIDRIPTPRPLAPLRCFHRPQGCCLSLCRLRCCLRSCCLRSCCLRSCCLRSCCLRSCCLRSCCLRSCCLRSCCLRSCCLRSYCLRSYCLRSYCLRSCCLRFCCLRSCCLRFCCLRSCCLRSCCLRSCCLRSRCLRSCCLRVCCLRSCCLRF